MLRRLAALAALLGVAVLVTSLLAPAGASAAERHCRLKAVRGDDGAIHYVKICETVTPGQPGGPGDDGGAPPCETDKMAYSPMPGYGPWFCVGRAVCAIKDNIVPMQPPGTAPPPGQEWKLQHCWPCNGCLGPPAPSWVLSGTVARPLIVQAQEAFGNLDPPHAEVHHSPTAEAVVHLRTWLWLDPGTFARRTGTSAEGLVAVAEPQSTVWDTGDGHTLTCPDAGADYANQAAGGTPCTYIYPRAGEFSGTVTRRWAVHYENGGATVDIAGAPDTLVADSAFDLTVVETQVVTGD
jgi:hypothetical protein